MAENTVRTPERRLLPPLTVPEQQELASALVFDWQSMTQGKAGATLTATRDGVTITAKSKPLEVVAYRMRLYRDIPLLFGLFVRRQNGGGVWDKLQAHFTATFPEVVV